ncbi:MAG: hypothetical protein A2315_01820 [Ignavibacteria bacterium RIFOXYB2_FULL_35_12]|nr:MAG: hypothetical protein A2058_01355 [Ignavibacteria bacterium GWA2_36_19]OGU62120.1 MAG: hypothetical protein A2X60_00470 [Ignavibacteria bacterium GWF2_35_20]OGU87690.1 MAG: hypothetical protein A3K31_06290 [Ignavibacteria bacterium RIFOXYA12_FULL_35_25]OGU89844.1 MAG: hypothetical protein A2492_07875 [Ignavibacteria bacterium RIFOXYC12_FULL_35_11]OGU96548.1 MAG: hypothetical protein A2347_10855 [Ignavibacteria bacterium RIFOXYB12_FULL_35_14]OGU99470.1 MAG: hypothetical protein A2455_037
MSLRTTSRHSGEKFYLRKFWLTIISLVLVSIHIHAQNGCTMKSQIPTQRAGACACVVDNKIYVIGGITGSPGYSDLAVNEMYDPLTDTWTTKSPLPQARGYLSCAVVNDTIYVIGGGWATATKRVDVYDPVTDTWTQKADMLSVRRSAQACVVDGIIYNIGGNKGISQASTDCEAYNPATDTWTAKTNMPAGGGNLAATVYNGLICTFGGSNYTTWTGFSYVYAYNPLTNSWAQKQNMPTARFGLQACVYSNKIYVIGGSQSQSTALGTVEVYDPVNDTWEQGDNMPIISAFLTGAVVNDKIYVIGGTPDWSTGLANVWEYDPEYVVPVELTSFTATANGKEVALNWSTATELNNQGFEVQRKFGSNDFATIGSVKGNGTTTSPNQYTYVDRLIDPGKYFYRLKQIDFDGKFEYSQTVEINWSPFITYKLEQNYPNPFNPSTKISWQFPVSSWQTLKVYDVIGNDVATLVDEFRPAGNYEVEFTASNLASGIYFYQLKTGSLIETKKMILLR